MASIRENLAAVQERIARAAREVGRDPASVRLIAVSKTKPVEAIREAYAAGQRDFGENYVQELIKKAEALANLSDIRWHVIGHLQRNKAKLITERASMLHTLDSVRLAEELAKRAATRTTPLPVLVEVNIGDEAEKSGCKPSELAEIFVAAEREQALTLAGLMTVPPHTEDPAGARPFFDALVRLRDEHGGAARLPELSMGMTHDLEHAVYAGATLVRVGTAIFGERDNG